MSFRVAHWDALDNSLALKYAKGRLFSVVTNHKCHVVTF